MTPQWAAAAQRARSMSRQSSTPMASVPHPGLLTSANEPKADVAESVRFQSARQTG
jgi:hypothetical protein